MARYLKFDKELYGVDGLIGLVRGDDWSLPAKIVDLISGLEFDVDLTGAAASGFIPAASGGSLSATVDLTDPSCGKISINLSNLETTAALLSDTGLQAYVTLEDGSGLHTITPFDSPIKIQDRGATSS